MRRGFFRQNSEKKPLENTHNVQSPAAPGYKVLTMRGHTMDVLSADEIVKSSNLNIKAINALGTDAYAALLEGQRLDLLKIQVKGPGYTFHGAALFDSRIVPLLPASFADPPPSPDGLFEIRSVEGMGQGVFALKAIPTGALILVEHPSIVSPILIQTSQRPRYTAAFELLNQSAAAELRMLANSMPPGVCRTEEEGIIRTNNITLNMPVPQAMEDLGAFKPHGGIFVKGSRFNHSCGPNADHEWDINTFSVSFYAVRPIRAGEEITISYLNLLTPREHRRTRLRNMYYFDCQCKYCDLPSAQAIARSDATRAQLAKEPSPSFSDWLNNPGLADDVVVQACKERLAWAGREGLEEHNLPYVHSIVGCYMALGDEKNFCKWARKAEEALATRNPLGAANYRKWRANPRTAPIWGRRKLVVASDELQERGS